MKDRTLTITLQSDWRAALRAAGQRAQASSYQGEVLDFETPGAFLGRLTERRWALVHALQGQGELAVRELARRVGRDVKRVHDDVQVLADLAWSSVEPRAVLCALHGDATLTWRCAQQPEVDGVRSCLLSQDLTPMMRRCGDRRARGLPFGRGQASITNVITRAPP